MTEKQIIAKVHARLMRDANHRASPKKLKSHKLILREIRVPNKLTHYRMIPR